MLENHIICLTTRLTELRDKLAKTLSSMSAFSVTLKVCIWQILYKNLQNLFSLTVSLYICVIDQARGQDG